jgi:hypothetical protein
LTIYGCSIFASDLKNILFKVSRKKFKAPSGITAQRLCLIINVILPEIYTFVNRNFTANKKIPARFKKERKASVNEGGSGSAKRRKPPKRKALAASRKSESRGRVFARLARLSEKSKGTHFPARFFPQDMV